MMMLIMPLTILMMLLMTEETKQGRRPNLCGWNPAGSALTAHLEENGLPSMQHPAGDKNPNTNDKEDAQKCVMTMAKELFSLS